MTKNILNWKLKIQTNTLPAGEKESIANRYMTIFLKQTAKIYVMNRMSLGLGRKTVHFCMRLNFCRQNK